VATLAKPARTEPNVPVYKPDESLLAPEKAEDNAEELPIKFEELIEELISVPLATNKVKLPVRIARRISAFYDRLCGPPLTQQDRMRATLVDVENSRGGNIVV